MRFDYGTLLSPAPIVLSIGTLVKPKLREIADTTKGMSFDKFNYFEFLIKMTPEIFYTKIKGDEGKEYWISLSDDEQADLTLYHVVINDKQLLKMFIEILNFFFVEKVTFRDGYFILLNTSDKKDNDIATQPEIRGVISENIFLQVLNAIQQVCCIADKEDNIDELQFKNKLAKKMYHKMQNAAKKARKERNDDINFTLPNIISAVSNRHPTIDPINVWDMTVFQLLDSFNRLQLNSMFSIDATRVSVWGDEKKTFNAALWYKNEYDKK